MGGSEKNWGGQKFKTGFCGGVRSLKREFVGGSQVQNGQKWGGQMFQISTLSWGVKCQDYALKLGLIVSFVQQGRQFAIFLSHVSGDSIYIG